MQAEIILLCVRWYLRYPLSYRDLEERYCQLGENCRDTNANLRKSGGLAHVF